MTMATYNTEMEVLTAVTLAYAHATELSRAFRLRSADSTVPETFCYYSHATNGIGCAIGCLLDDDELLQKWDTVGSIFSVSYHFPEEFAQHFGEAVSLGFLQKLQGLHDLATNVSDFRLALENLWRSRYPARQLAEREPKANED
jgi:hypothetical protein